MPRTGPWEGVISNLDDHSVKTRAIKRENASHRAAPGANLIQDHGIRMFIFGTGKELENKLESPELLYLWLSKPASGIINNLQSSKDDLKAGFL